MRLMSGKWDDPAVPHHGWTCVHVEDLEKPSATCEMCGIREIRYVHTMEHPDYPDTLQVGCVCAEKMEGDPEGPRQRERRLQQLAKRRLNWPHRRWLPSYDKWKDFDGAYYINTEGYHLRVFPQGSGWKILVRHNETRAEQVGKRDYLSEGEAKIAALDALLWAKDHLH
jgi:hypothetical protein